MGRTMQVKPAAADVRRARGGWYTQSRVAVLRSGPQGNYPFLTPGECPAIYQKVARGRYPGAVHVDGMPLIIWVIRERVT